MKTWRKYRTYTRVQRLWKEYKEVAVTELNKSDGRLVLVSQKLSAFLEAFQAAYHEFKNEFSKSSTASSSALNAFYGDCSELLLSLLELVDRHAMNEEAAQRELSDPALVAASSGRASPAEMASKVKGMVEKASESVDAKLVDKVRQGTEKVASHAGAVISSPELHSKLAGWTQQASDPEVAYHIAETVNKALSVAELIIREEKYRGIATVDAPEVTKRLLSLLDNVKTPEAKQIALRMIGFMAMSMESRLEICRLDGYRRVLRVLRESPDAITKEAINTLSHLMEAHDCEAAAAATDAPPRLREAIQTANTRTEALGLKLSLQPSQVWESTKAVMANAKRFVGSDQEPAGVDATDADDAEAGPGGVRAEFPPSRVSIARRIEEVELEVKELFEMEPSPLERNLTPRSFANYLATEHMHGEGLDDELMREIMGVQGALTTLTQKLAEAARDVKLDLMSTISKLLRNSKRNQREFKKIKGYGFLSDMFDSITDYQTPPSQMFLRDVFGIMQSIILDGTPEKTVKNLDALELVLRLVSSESHIEVRRRAVLCVQELLVINELNVVCIRKVKGFSSLLQGMTRVSIPRRMEGAVLYTRPEYRLVEEIRETLSYAAVLLSKHDCELIEDILRVGMSSGQPIHPVVRQQLLTCACDLLRDRNSRKLAGVPSAVVESIVKSLQLVLRVDTPLSPPSASSETSATCLYDDVPQPLHPPKGDGTCSPDARARAGDAMHQHGDGTGSADRHSSSSTRPACSSAGDVGEDDEDEKHSSFVGFVRTSMGLRNTKDNAFIIMLEALAHIVSLDLRPSAADEKTTRGSDLNALAKNLHATHRAGDKPRELESLRGRLASGDAFDEVLSKSFSVERPIKFEELQGFDMIVEAIMSDMCESVSSMSLWMLLELSWIALGEHDLTRYIVRVLDIPRLSVRKRLMCLAMLRSWLLDLDPADKGVELRVQLRDSGCMASLVSILQGGGPAIAREAFLTLSTLVSSCEKMKSSLEIRIGFEKLASIVGESALVKPKPAFDLVLVEAVFQMASFGPVQPGIVSSNFGAPPKLAPWVLQCNSILNVRRPSPLYVARLTTLHTPEPSGLSGVSGAETKSETASMSRRSECSSRTGGHRREPSVSSRTSDKAQGPPKSVSSISSDGVEQNVDDLDLQPGDMDTSSSLVLEQARDKYIIRSKDAASMIVQIVRHADMESQLVMLEALQHIVQANPANSLTFCDIKATASFLEMVHPCNGMAHEVQESCMQTLALIGQYHITADEVSTLISHATPQVSEEESDDVASCAGADDDMRLMTMDAMYRICKSTLPKNFFHCNGRPGWVRVAPVEKFPPAKLGYTLSCWIRVLSFVGEEATFVRWLQSDGEQILELYFQRLGADDDSARCLSVRTHPRGLRDTNPASRDAQSQPFAFNAFNAHSFAADAQWHHMVFAQCNRTLSLFLDGAFVQSCAFTTYVAPATGPTSKERPLVAMFCGGHSEGSTGGIRGQVSPILLTEGVWDSKTVSAQFALGPFAEHSSAKPVRAPLSASDHSTIMVVSPSTCFKGRMHVDKSDGLKLAPLNQLFDCFSKMGVGVADSAKADAHRERERDREGKKAKDDSKRSGRREPDLHHHGELGGWIEMHCTQSLPEALSQVGGVALLLRAMHGHLRQDLPVATLRLLAQLLERGDNDFGAEFWRLRGDLVVLYILSQYDALQEPVFDVLFQLAAGGDGRSGASACGIKYPQFALLAMYLFHTAAPAVQRHVLRGVDDCLMTAGRSGREVWMTSPGLGLPVLFNLVRALDSSLLPTLMNLVMQTAPSWGASEIEELVAFVVGAQVAVEVRAQLLELMIQLWTQQTVAIDNIRGQNGFEYVFCILDTPSEELRCRAIKMLALMLDDAKCQKAFSKLNGFEVLSRLLGNHDFTSQTPTTLLQMALGSFKVEGVPPASTSGSDGAASLLHPQAVQVLLELLPKARDQELPAAACGFLLKFLEKKSNAAILLACGALDWCRLLLRCWLTSPTSRACASPCGGGGADSAGSDSGAQGTDCDAGATAGATTLPAESKAVLTLHAIIGRLFVCGMEGDIKALRLKELVDSDDIYLVLVGQVLAHFEKRSHISASSASSVLRTLAQLLEPLVEIVPVSQPSLYLQVVRMINSITNHNTDLIRSTMKEVSLLDLRDALLMQCLRLPLTCSGAAAIMQGFSFEWVADKSTFRDAHGLTHLLHMFHTFSDEDSAMLQKAIGCVIRNVFGPIADNRKMLAKVIDDPEVAAVFFPAGVGAGGLRRSLDLQSGLDDDLDPSEESGRVMDTFLEWYYKEEQRARREAIEARVRAQMKAIQVSVAAAQDKARAKRAKRLKSIVEAEKKAKDKLDKTVDGWVDDKKRMRRLEALKVAVAAQVENEKKAEER